MLTRSRFTGPAKLAVGALVSFVLLAGGATSASALTTPSTRPPDRTAATDVTGIAHAVRSLDATVHFYHDVLGLEVVSEDARPKIDIAYGRLTGTAGLYRTAVIAIPNQEWTLTLTQYYGPETHTVVQREQDPGAPALTLTVKNAVEAFAALRAANTPTVNGLPIPVGNPIGQTSPVFVLDPDGYIVEAVQRSGPADYFSVPAPTVTDGPGMKYVIRGQIDLTVATASDTLAFYQGVLGLDIAPGFVPLVGPGEYKPMGFLGFLFNVDPTVLWTAITGNCNPTTRCEFFEYQDPNRVTIDNPIQDPGIGVTTYVVPDLDATLAQVRSTGLKIVTPGDQPVRIDGTRSILVRDPSGYLLRLDASKGGH